MDSTEGAPPYEGGLIRPATVGGRYALGEPYVDLRQYVEALFREKERALDMAAQERDRAAEVLRDEQRRAIATAEAEREKAASALRAGTDRAISDNYERLHELFLTMFAEQGRALKVAEEEREKAASALRTSLAQSIAEGDERLREHIANQIAQINATLKSGDLLEIARVDGLSERLEAKLFAAEKYGIERAEKLIAMIDSNTREFRQIQTAAMQAIEKAEEAQQRVNLSQNEFRQTLSDQAATLMPRRESESRHDEAARTMTELRADIAQLRTEIAVGPAGLSELARTASLHDGANQHKKDSQAQTLTLIGVAAAIGLVVVEFVTRAH